MNSLSTPLALLISSANNILNSNLFELSFFIFVPLLNFGNEINPKKKTQATLVRDAYLVKTMADLLSCLKAYTSRKIDIYSIILFLIVII